MRSIATVAGIVCFGSLAITNFSFADNSAIQRMADITINLNHYPSESDKQELAAIINSSQSSQAEIAVATAIANIEHKVTSADKEKVKENIADESTPAELRELASIVININHRPTESDIAELEKIVVELSR